MASYPVIVRVCLHMHVEAASEDEALDKAREVLGAMSEGDTQGVLLTPGVAGVDPRAAIFADWKAPPPEVDSE